MSVFRPKCHLPMSWVQRPTHGGYDVARMSCVWREGMLNQEYVFFGDDDEGFSRLLIVLELISGSLQAPLLVDVPDSLCSLTGPEIISESLQVSL
jgi:hypothetical protein